MFARPVIFVVLLSMLSLPIHAQQTPPTQPQTEIIFPGDTKFSELESKFQEKTKISAWAEEFKKRQVFGQVRSNNGISGTLFTEALALVALLADQVPYIIYGTISIPQGAKLAQRDFPGNYGIVVIANPFVAALIDITSGNIGAFLALPAQTSTIPLFPFFPIVTPLLGPLGIFEVIVSLITVPTPTPQMPPTPPLTQPPQTPAPTCPQDLPHKSDVNTPLHAPAIIATVSDNTKLFEIGVAPPGFLTVQSFASSLQFRYITAFQQRLGIIIGPGTQQIPLMLDLPFVLFATSGAKSVCLQAMPKLVNGVLTLVGTMSAN